MSVRLLNYNQEVSSVLKNKDLDFFYDNDGSQTNYEFGDNYNGSESP
jgi:hypothetical protein